MSYQLQAHAQDSKLIHLDSRDATSYLQSGHTSYFTYHLKEKIVIPSNQMCLVSLNSATIPYSFYNIRTEVNDRIEIAVRNADGSNTGYGVYIIPSGNYSAFSLAKHIKDNLHQTTLNASPNYSGGVITPTGYVVTAGYSTDTQKFTFSVSSAVEVFFLFQSGTKWTDKDANAEMGFDDEDVSFTNTRTQTSTNVIDINGSIHGVYVRTNLTSKSLIDSQNASLSNILARIPIQVQSGGIIFFNPRDNSFKAMIQRPDIDILTIRLTDERNRILNLNGLHFQVSIQLDFIYQQAVIPPPAGRHKGATMTTQQQKEESEQMYQQSRAVRQAIAEGRAKITQDEEGEDVVVPVKQKKKKRAGRPRQRGRPTYKELRRVEKIKVQKAEALLDKQKSQVTELNPMLTF